MSGPRPSCAMNNMVVVTSPPMKTPIHSEHILKNRYRQLNQWLFWRYCRSRHLYIKKDLLLSPFELFKMSCTLPLLFLFCLETVFVLYLQMFATCAIAVSRACANSAPKTKEWCGNRSSCSLSIDSGTYVFLALTFSLVHGTWNIVNVTLIPTLYSICHVCSDVVAKLNRNLRGICIERSICKKKKNYGDAKFGIRQSRQIFKWCHFLFASRAPWMHESGCWRAIGRFEYAEFRFAAAQLKFDAMI